MNSQPTFGTRNGRLVEAPEKWNTYQTPVVPTLECLSCSFQVAKLLLANCFVVKRLVFENLPRCHRKVIPVKTAVNACIEPI